MNEWMIRFARALFSCVCCKGQRLLGKTVQSPLRRDLLHAPASLGQLTWEDCDISQVSLTFTYTIEEFKKVTLEIFAWSSFPLNGHFETLYVMIPIPDANAWCEISRTCPFDSLHFPIECHINVETFLFPPPWRAAQIFQFLNNFVLFLFFNGKHWV